MARKPQAITLEPSEASVSHGEAIRRLGLATEILLKIQARVDSTADCTELHADADTRKFITIPRSESIRSWKSTFWKFAG